MTPEPTRITFALDNPQTGDRTPLEGPDVDTACGAVEPDVDCWETGLLSPAPEQLVKLAALTGYPVGWFFGEPLQPVSGWVCRSRPRRCEHVTTDPGHRLRQDPGGQVALW